MQANTEGGRFRRPDVIYFDSAACARMSKETVEHVKELLDQGIANAASQHSAGRRGSALIDDARFALAQSMQADASEIVFTSGGTESINTAIKGLWWDRAKVGEEGTEEEAGGRAKSLILSSKLEHPATLNTIEFLQEYCGASVIWVGNDRSGRIDIDDLRRVIEKKGRAVALGTFSHANNEIGVIQPIGDICRILQEQNIPTHVDCVASFGVIPVRPHMWGATCVSVAAHKVRGPLAVGALWVRKGTKIVPLLHGGGAEFGRRAGTQDFIGISAFGKAVTEFAMWDSAVLYEKRERLIKAVFCCVQQAQKMGAKGLNAHLSGGDAEIELNATTGRVTGGVMDVRGSQGDVLPSIAHFIFKGCKTEVLLSLLDMYGICASGGAACTSGVVAASHVLLACGIGEEEAECALRFSINTDTSIDEIEYFESVFADVLFRAYSSSNLEN